MKILYAVHQFFPEYITGTERFTFNLASSLQKAGHHVKVTCYSFALPELFYRRRGLLLNDYTYRGIPVTAFKHIKGPPDLNQGLAKDEEVYLLAWEIMKQGKYDLLHVTHPMRMHPFVAAARDLNIPYVLTLTDHFLVCSQVILLTLQGELCFGPQDGERCRRECLLPRRDKRYFRKRLSRAREILSGAALAAVPSQFMVNIFKQEFPDISIKVIPYGIDVRRISYNNKLYEAGIPVTFGFMGGVAPHKGVHFLIEAFRRLEDEGCRLKIHGLCHLPLYLEQLKALAAGDRRIEFCGAYSLEENLNDILNSIDVLCVPSTCHDTHPLVLQEAKAAGVPVIGARRGGIPESIKDGVNGFIFDPRSVDNLYHLMVKIVKEPPLLNDFKKRITLPPLVEEEAITYEQIYRKTLLEHKSNSKKKRWFF